MTDLDEQRDVRIVVLGVGLLALAVVWNIVGNLALPGAWYVPANLTVAAVFLAAARSTGFGWDELGLAPTTMRRGTVIGVGAAAVVAIVITIGLFIPAIETYFEDDSVAADSTFDRWFVPLVRIPLGTAVFEEVLFRSVLFAIAVRLWGVRWAIAATSIVFGLWHIVPAWEGSTGSGLATAGAIVGVVAVTTIAGVLFAGLRVWSGSVLAPTFAHWATNSLSYAAAILALESI